MKKARQNKSTTRRPELTPWFDQFRDANGEVDFAKSRQGLIMRDFDILHAFNTDIGWPPNCRIVAIREMSEPHDDISGDMPDVDARQRMADLLGALELDQTMAWTGFMLEAPYDPITQYTRWSWGWLSLVAVPLRISLQQVRSKLMDYDKTNDRDLGQKYSISDADSPRQLFQHLSEIIDMEVFFYKDLIALDEAMNVAIIPETAIARAKALLELIPDGKRACVMYPIKRPDHSRGGEKVGTVQ